MRKSRYRSLDFACYFSVKPMNYSQDTRVTVNTAALTKLRTKIISYFIVIVIKLLDNT